MVWVSRTSEGSSHGSCKRLPAPIFFATKLVKGKISISTGAVVSPFGQMINHVRTVTRTSCSVYHRCKSNQVVAESPSNQLSLKFCAHTKNFLFLSVLTRSLLTPCVGNWRATHVKNNSHVWRIEQGINVTLKCTRGVKTDITPARRMLHHP